MKTKGKATLAVAVGAGLVSGLVQAEVNPFAMNELDSGYMLTAEAKSGDDSASKMKDGACGEGKCGAGMMKPATSVDKKSLEGKCAGNKPATPPATETKKN
jgi:uncharacterized low-complexity protein